MRHRAEATLVNELADAAVLKSPRRKRLADAPGGLEATGMKGSSREVWGSKLRQPTRRLARFCGCIALRRHRAYPSALGYRAGRPGHGRLGGSVAGYAAHDASGATILTAGRYQGPEQLKS
jgi:hypothetical protein